MDYSEPEKSVQRQPSLRNLTQADYGKPKPQQNKVRYANSTCPAILWLVGKMRDIASVTAGILQAKLQWSSQTTDYWCYS